MLMIVTPRNVLSRVFFSSVLIAGGVEIMRLPASTALIVGSAVLAAGIAIGFFALRWFWRLFILAWFR